MLLRGVGGAEGGRGRGEELEEEVGWMESEGRGDREEEFGRQLQHGPRLNELLGTIFLGCPGEAGPSQVTSRDSGGLKKMVGWDPVRSLGSAESFFEFHSLGLQVRLQPCVFHQIPSNLNFWRHVP